MPDNKGASGSVSPTRTTPQKRHFSKKELNIQPSSWESELSILSCILLDNKSMSVCLEEGLAPEDFYYKRTAITYSAMLSLYENGVAIDFMSLSEKIRQMGAENEATMDFLLGIADYLPAPVNIRFFVKTVKSLAERRRYIEIARHIRLLALEVEDVSRIETEVWNLLFSSPRAVQSYKPITALINKEVKTYEVFAHGAKVQQRAVWGILGATSAGKTEYALDLALAFVKSDIDNTVLFCEYEGTEDDLAVRVQRKANADESWKATERISVSMKPDFMKIVDYVVRHRERNILIIVDYLQRFARMLQSDDSNQKDNLRIYVNNIYGFFDRLRNDYPNVSTCLLMSMSKQGISEVSRQKRADKIDLLNAIKESGDVQYDLDYSYAMLFTEGKNDDSMSLSRITQDKKIRKYMHLYPIKDARIGEPLRETVFTFSPERHSYELIAEVIPFNAVADEGDNGL